MANMQAHAEQVWEQGPCSVNEHDEGGDGGDGDEWYYCNGKMYVGKPLHKQTAPARSAQARAAHAHATRARTAQTELHGGGRTQEDGERG